MRNRAEEDPGSSAQRRPEGGRLRIFSANLLQGRADIVALVDQLHALRVDVAAFQEFSAAHVDAVAAVLPHGGLRLPGGYMMALALRHPATVAPIALAGRNAHFASLSPESWPQLSVPLEVVTTHIRAPHLWPPWETVRRRRAQVRGLTAHIGASPDQPRVLVGDLNATPLWPAYRRLTGLLDDAALSIALRRGHAAARTWAPRPHGPRLLRLDHGLVRRVTVHDFQVVPVRGSDHAGILIEVSPN